MGAQYRWVSSRGSKWPFEYFIVIEDERRARVRSTASISYWLHTIIRVCVGVQKEDTHTHTHAYEPLCVTRQSIS